MCGLGGVERSCGPTRVRAGPHVVGHLSIVTSREKCDQEGYDDYSAELLNVCVNVSHRCGEACLLNVRGGRRHDPSPATLALLAPLGDLSSSASTYPDIHKHRCGEASIASADAASGPGLGAQIRY